MQGGHGMAINIYINKRISRPSTMLGGSHQEDAEVFGKLADANKHEEVLEQRVQEANDILSPD
jgi:hypothetical protein